jgi:hypothetical protein
LIKHLYNEKVKTKVISYYLACHIGTTRLWANRDGVKDMTRTGRPVVYGQLAQLSLMGFYCQTTPFTGCGKWTVRLASKYLIENPDGKIGEEISKSTVHRVLQANNLKPHRSKYYLHVSDPDFFPKMNHIIDLYLNPPKNLYCFDECPGIQALKRKMPDIRTENQKIRLKEFEYGRNGTIDVLAFFSVNTGKVFATCRPNHKIGTLIEVFEKQLELAPKNEPLHYIMDNLNSHCCYDLCVLIAKHSEVDCPPLTELDNMEKRREWLMSSNKRIIFHYTPFHGSWLNQVEIWFGILGAKCFDESYGGPDALYKAIYEFIELWNTLLFEPFKWKYTGKGLPEKVVKIFIKILISSENMDVAVTVKMLKLMVNMINDFWDEIPYRFWNDLNNRLNEKYETIKTNILNAKSRASKRDERIESLDSLKLIINNKTKNNYKKVA